MTVTQGGMETTVKLNNNMRIKELLKESLTSISQNNDGGSLEGYVVDTNQPNVRNYLQSQHVDEKTINKLISQFNRIGLIRNMYVDDESQGQGYGTDLMNNAIDMAFDEGAEAIILVADLSEENKVDLVKWYNNYGFETIGNAAGDPLMMLVPDK